MCLRGHKFSTLEFNTFKEIRMNVSSMHPPSRCNERIHSMGKMSNSQ